MLKNLLPALLLGATVLLSGSRARAQTYQQVWADEFDTGIGPDWTFETGNNNGWGNNEKQYYQAANATVVNGVLQITAKRQQVGSYAYTSARMKTQNLRSFRYGRIEARIKLPLGQGLWPGFWMMGSNIGQVGWPKCGEIDIMEHINANNVIYGTGHWDNNGHVQYGLTTTVVSPDDWHVYRVDWTPTAITWFVDGTQFCALNIANGVGSTEEFQNSFFILLNLAVGGNLPGQTIDESKLPASLQVDYVRVSQLPAVTPVVGVIQAEDFNYNNGMVAEACTDVGGGLDMSQVDAGDYLVFNNIDFPTTGNYLIEYRVASGATGGTISSDLNAGTIPLGNTAIPATGGWQSWTTVSRTVFINAGRYNYGVFAQTGGWNINWIRITPPGAAPLATAAAAGPAPFTLYPNPRPAAEPLQLALPGCDAAHPATVRLLDGLGREVWRTTATSAAVELSPARPLASGLYLVQVGDASGQHTQRLVVQ